MASDYQYFHPHEILMCLKTNRQLQKTLVMFLTFDLPLECRLEALKHSEWILEDTILLLKSLLHHFDSSPQLGVNPRLPKGFSSPFSAKNFIETMQVTLDLLALEVEWLLNQTLDVSEEIYQHRSERIKELIKVMGYFARYTKLVVLAKDPGAWDETIEKRFEKLLKISP